MVTFVENFGRMVGGFSSQTRVNERVLFETMVFVYPDVREAAMKYDDALEGPKSNLMLEEVETRMRIARVILDVPTGKEEDSAVFDEPAVRMWILRTQSLDKAPLTRKVYDRYLLELVKLDPKLASDMTAAHKQDQARM